MKTLYTSPVFKNENGSEAVFWVPMEAVKTYASRDAAVLKIKALGGINAPSTPESKKLISTIIRAKRKIESNGWFCTKMSK